MGYSRSVQQQIERDRRNQQFIDQIEANLKRTLEGAENDLETRINNFYNSGSRIWQHRQYIIGSQQSYEIQDTWNLDNLLRLINNITNAVIGTVTGEIILPEGTEASSEVRDINRTADLNQDLRLLVSTNTINLFSGILNSFGAINTIKADRATQTISLGQGLRIFATIGVNIQRSASFFNNSFTIGYYYVYKVQYSLDEFAQQAEQTLVAQYNRDLQALNIASERVFQQYIDEIITIEQFLNTSSVLQNQTRAVIDKIAELNRNNRQDTIQLRQRQLAWLTRLQINYGYNKDVDPFLSPLINESKQKINASES